MSARQEDRVDVAVHAHFTRLRLVQSTILRHQLLLLVVCTYSQFTVIITHCLQTTLGKTALDRGRTNRISLTHDLDLHLQSH